MTKQKALRKISEWISKQDWEYTEAHTARGLWYLFVEEDRDAMDIVYHMISAVASFCGLSSRITYCGDGANEVEVQADD